MTNKEIAKVFNELAGIMELHQENPFKIRSYQNAYIQLRKLQTPLADMSDAELSGVKGIGKTIVAKVRELLATGELDAMKKYQDVTPPGVQEMLKIKGFGPKKIRVIWKDLGAESIGELLYACNENRLIELKGFGQKTQEDLRQKLNYYQQSKGKFHFAALEAESTRVLDQLKQNWPDHQINLVGAMRRRDPIVESIDILIGGEELSISQVFDEKKMIFKQEHENYWEGISPNELPLRIYRCSAEEFGSKLFRYTATPDFMAAFLAQARADDFRFIATEEEVFAKAGIPYMEPELREGEYFIQLAGNNQLPKLVEEGDIKGVIHTHTQYSDGLHSLEEMAEYARSQGYAYIGITDHSKSAFYANGLKQDRLEEQWQEIEALNKTMAPFRILKGIESDILNDGSLDYEEELLQRFDFIIASVHSNLKMDELKATNRLIKAIENPYTNILGHPTGRLLLSRKGYPIDHKKVIDACAANQVVIELNANPYRLDLDWSWIPYAVEKGVFISINPDAHSKEGIQDIRFGIYAARKGGLEAAQCLNCFSLPDFKKHLSKI